MAYKVQKYSSFDKDIKSLTPQQKTDLKEAAMEIEKNPTVGDFLKSNMAGLKKYSFGRKPEIRILYTVYECKRKSDSGLICIHGIEHEVTELNLCNGLIEYVFVKTREQCNSLYSQKRKYFNQYLR